MRNKPSKEQTFPFYIQILLIFMIFIIFIILVMSVKFRLHKLLKPNQKSITYTFGTINKYSKSTKNISSKIYIRNIS